MSVKNPNITLSHILGRQLESLALMFWYNRLSKSATYIRVARGTSMYATVNNGNVMSVGSSSSNVLLSQEFSPPPLSHVKY